MTGNYDNTNRGALFKNDRKETDNHPDYTGNVNVGGRDFWLSAWIKTDRNGKKFMSLAVKPKEQRAGRQPQRSEAYGDHEDPAPRAAPRAVRAAAFDDDPPF